MKKNLLKGNKITKSHSTLIPLASEVVVVLKNLESVNKIVISVIKTKNSAPNRISISRIENGLKMIVSCGSASQILYIYTKEEYVVIGIMMDKWKEIMTQDSKKIWKEMRKI